MYISNHRENIWWSYPPKYTQITFIESWISTKTQLYAQFGLILSKYGSNHCQTMLTLISCSRESKNKSLRSVQNPCVELCFRLCFFLSVSHLICVCHKTFYSSNGYFFSKKFFLTKIIYFPGMCICAHKYMCICYIKMNTMCVCLVACGSDDMWKYRL